MNSIDRTSRNLWVGIGCQRGISKLAIEHAIEWIFAQYDLDLATIKGIATLDRKSDELGLVDYCRESGLFLKTYSPERLNSVDVVRSSKLVTALVGALSVAEASALSAAQVDRLLVPKQKFQYADRSKWVTIAVARSNS